ncbi:unnamed protein product [Paramecium pentaurelia]|uniref:Uncharacterized protein n=1 Tax=Paramecium pentaurelia TaxID=43138 RepID=A0A8S1SWN1_9CILI|nr:unnamed protein product [Paramecium pentaurelia]
MELLFYFIKYDKDALDKHFNQKDQLILNQDVEFKKIYNEKEKDGTVLRILRQFIKKMILDQSQIQLISRAIDFLKKIRRVYKIIE